MLAFWVFACASYNVSFEKSSSFDLYDSGIMDAPVSSEEDAGMIELVYHWQPVIDLKIDANGNVIFEGSKSEIWFFENGVLACVEELANLALVQTEAPVEQAHSCGGFVYFSAELASRG